MTDGGCADSRNADSYDEEPNRDGSPLPYCRNADSHDEWSPVGAAASPFGTWDDEPTEPVMVLSPDADDGHNTQCSVSSVNSNATMVMSSKPNEDKKDDDAKLDKAMARCAYPYYVRYGKYVYPHLFPFISRFVLWTSRVVLDVSICFRVIYFHRFLIFPRCFQICSIDFLIVSMDFY
jgi:hypothetical protein